VAPVRGDSMDLKVLGLAALAVLVVSVGFSVYAYVQVLPVVGWYEQAYSAADAEQMAQWLGNLLAEMERIGMTHGHYALIFKNPHNDVSVHVQSLRRRLRMAARARLPAAPAGGAGALGDFYIDGVVPMGEDVLSVMKKAARHEVGDASCLGRER